MNRTRIILTLGAALVLAAPPAHAITNTFTGEQSTAWRDNGNWDLGHWPRYTEDVVIPTGLTCIISTGYADAQSVEVEVDATLGVEEGWTLTIYVPAGPSPPPTMTVNGTVYLKEDEFELPAMIFLDPTVAAGDITLTGTGVITAARDAGYGAAILTTSPTLPGCMIIDADLTLKGTMTIRGPLANNGEILVDGPDLMYIEPSQFGGVCDATGLFRVKHAEGVVQLAGIQSVVPGGRISGWNFHVTDGLLEIVYLSGALLMADVTMLVEGGDITSDETLDCAGCDITIAGDTDDDAGAHFTRDLVLSPGVLPNTLSMGSEGWLRIDGTLDITDTTATQTAGRTRIFGDVLSTDSAFRTLGGLSEVLGAFTAQRVSGTSSVTVSGTGRLALNGGPYTGSDTTFVIADRGRLELWECEFSNSGRLNFAGGEIMAYYSTATFENP
jgi:hypothetical protein